MRLSALLPFPVKLIVYARTISVSGPRNEQEIFGKKKRKSEITCESADFILVFVIRFVKLTPK